MGKKVLFLDSVEKSDGSYNVTYGTDDINAIARSLTGAGVSIFPSGETFNVSDLNSITEAMVSAGVSFDGLRVSLSDGKIHIAPGVGFFENGAIITVDADGVELEYKVAENVYVYAEYDKTLNVCDFRTSEETPSDAEGVFKLMLAVIEADGTVNDRRAIAVSKVASMGRNAVFDIPLPGEPTGSPPSLRYPPRYILWEGELDLSHFNYVIAYFVVYEPDDSLDYVKVIESVIRLNEGPLCVCNSYSSGQADLYLEKVGSKVRLYASEGSAGTKICTSLDGDINFVRFV